MHASVCRCFALYGTTKFREYSAVYFLFYNNYTFRSVLFCSVEFCDGMGRHATVVVIGTLT